MEIAFGVERAVNDVDAALCQEQWGVMVEGGQNDLIDLLVAVMTSVPNTLLQKLYKLESSGDGMDAQQQHHHQQHFSSMEEICFNSACISSDVMIKHVIDGDDFDSLGESHVQELVEQVISFCEGEGIGMNILYPIIQLLNTVADQRQIERTLFEQGYVGQDFEYHDPRSLFNMCAKDTLRLFRMLLRLMESEMSTFQSSQVGFFASYLLVHFADTALIESGHSTFQECQDLFRVWADGVNEHMTRRLTENDAGVILDSILQFQIDSIQAALQLIERTDRMISALASDEGMNDEANSGNSDECIAAVQDSIRRVSMSVSVTEVMERLGIEPDPEIHVIFHPLIVNFADFVALGLQDAHLIGFGQEGQALSHMADDLLIRICHTSIGIDFLKHCDDVKRDEVFAVAILRALSSGCIAGKGKFLLEMASNSAQEAEVNPNSKPLAKRQCHSGFHGKPSLGSFLRTDTTSSSKAQHDMTDIMTLCMTLSQSYFDEGMDRSSVDQTACIASSLMSSDQNTKHQVLDPLNPWHSLNVNFMKELSSRLEKGSQDEHGNCAISSYSSALPSCFDTSAASLSI